MSRTRSRSGALSACALSLVAIVAMLPSSNADAFCGFYVSGADGKLFNNATQVVMMREGTRTVLSMQNNYEGPPSDFAMVIPVPVVLQKENVKILPPEAFVRVDQMAAPRLVEYWERDPCYEPPEESIWDSKEDRVYSSGPVDDFDGVQIEAKFEVGEYEIVILSADDSGGLEQPANDGSFDRCPDSDTY